MELAVIFLEEYFACQDWFSLVWIHLFASHHADPLTIVKVSSHEDAQPMTESSNAEVNTSSAVAAGESDESQEIGSPKSLKDAIKPKHKRKKKSDKS